MPKVKVQGPQSGYRCIRRFFNHEPVALEVTAAELEELKEERILNVIELSDDFDLAQVERAKPPTVESLRGEISELRLRLDAASAAFTEMSESFSQLREQLTAKGKGKAKADDGATA